MALPPEALGPGEGDLCGKLVRSLYGTRDAAANWADKYTDVLLGLGFSKGDSSPCTFFHVERSIRLTVHGDDLFLQVRCLIPSGWTKCFVNIFR